MRTITPSVEDFIIEKEPYYLPIGGEVELFEQAYKARLPVMIKGPTGTGKTRFVAHMAFKLGRPLVTVACHEDLTASDLVGRYLILGDETVWADGPLTAAVRHGAIIYLDELVEARKDTLVVIHPLTDDRRVLPIDKLGTILRADDDFMMVVSYNPGYQSVLKELKPSTKQRFVAMDFAFPPADREAEILINETGIDRKLAYSLVGIGGKVRNLVDRGLEEGVSTRLLVYSAKLIANGANPRIACEAALTRILSEDRDLRRSITEIIADYL